MNISFRIKATKSFLENYKLNLDTVEIIKFEKFKDRLRLNPYLGDPIRVKFVREFKTSFGKRLYFIVYYELRIILFVAYSNKKTQRKVINDIFENLEEFRIFANKN